MNKSAEYVEKLFEYTLPWLVLIILLIFSFAKFFRHPYGFGWEPNGKIYTIFTEQPEPTLQVGDQLIQVGPMSWNDFHGDLRQTFFEGFKPKEIVPMVVERNGQILTVPWVIPGTNKNEVMDQLLSEWFLSYVFWSAGTLVMLFLRPRDERWWLLSAFSFLTAVWLGAGSGLSNYHIWQSAIILRMAIWLSIPVYLHLHWVFPRPLGKLSPWLIGIAYTAAIAFMVAQFFQLLPQDLYFLGFLVSILGSLILLIIHAIRQPDSRLELRLIWVAIFFALSPLLTIALVSFINGSSRLNGFVLISFPVLPLAYLYTAYRNQLGGLELRVNRLFSAYFFAILVGIVGLPLLALTNRALASMTDTALIVGFISGTAALVASIWGFPPFQSFVELRWLGISLPPQELPLIYSRHAIASTSLDALIKLLKEDVLPSLLIRQFIFLRLDGSSPEILLAVGVDQAQILQGQNLASLRIPKVSTSSAATSSSTPPPWVLLALRLKVGEELLGYWLFGRRDPDDIYPQNEIPILQSLADQTAITLSNIIQTERLRTVYQADINRFEQERLSLALELHDSILNEIVGLMMKIDERDLPPTFQDAYKQLIQHLRGIVKNLRPALITYGLNSAFEELADNLMERSGETIQVTVRLETNGERPTQDVEQHLFRIVQEACTNSLRHAKTTDILISGYIDSQMAEIDVLDNGTGFDVKGRLDLNTLLANNHFGLVGMIERAKLIGAIVTIESLPKAGTHVQVNWKLISEA